MRKEFAAWAEKNGKADPKAVFLTGDLGFMALENVKEAMGSRFVNAGVSEQNMISMGAALAHEGLRPICYSIAPFLVFRAYEQTRLDVCIHGKNVKLVGNGGGYGYGIMGATHHAIEDLASLSCLPRMRCFVPFCNQDVATVCEQMIRYDGPSYLRLGFGMLPDHARIPAYQPIRKLATGGEVTVVGVGPVTLNALTASTASADVFVVSELPLLELTSELVESLRRTRRLLVIEEHVKRGGLGEHLAYHLMKSGLPVTLSHLHAQGYPDGKYGNQTYHQKVNSLDAASIEREIQRLSQSVHASATQASDAR